MSIVQFSLGNLRGFEAPAALELKSLNVIVGRNGVGKSTLIDALLVGSAHNPADALGRIVRRRVGVQHGARWLLPRAIDPYSSMAKVSVTSSEGSTRETRISLMAASSAPLVEELARRQSFLTADDVQSLRVQIDDGKADAEHRVTFEVAFEPRNTYAVRTPEIPEPLRLGTYVRLVDAKLIGEPLTDAFSRAVTTGSIANVVEMLQQSEPGISGLQILTDQEQPYLAATVRGMTIPLSLVGDGVRLLARLAFEIQTMRGGGVLLIEEPELHQHPVTIGAIAGALVAASRRNVQVVITTHSLDMVRAMRQQFDVATDVQPDIALFCIERNGAGVCEVTRTAGREVLLDSDSKWVEFCARFATGDG